MHDLKTNTWDIHDGFIECNFCENTYETKSDLMKHKKGDHTKRLYSVKFVHIGKTNVGSFINKDGANLNSSQYVCNFCEHIFRNRLEF
jgi:hypothetical protein